MFCLFFHCNTIAWIRLTVCFPQFTSKQLPKIAHYNMRIKEEGTVFNEKVEIDEAKQTETLEVPAHNSAEEIQVLIDFKMVSLNLSC